MTQKPNKRQKSTTNHESLVNQGAIQGGKGSSESVEAMSQQELLESLDQLNREFKDFEAIREGIGTRMASIAQLVPRLNERKRLLKKDIEQNRKEVQQYNHHIPLLNKQRAGFLQRIRNKQKEQTRLEMEIILEQDKVKEITDQIVALSSKRTKTENVIQQKQDEIAKIDEQIKEIESVQQYSVNFVSTLVYTSKNKGNKKIKKKHRFSNYL